MPRVEIAVKPKDNESIIANIHYGAEANEKMKSSPISNARRKLELEADKQRNRHRSPSPLRRLGDMSTSSLPSSVADITVTVLQLSGILCEIAPSKKSNSRHTYPSDAAVSAVASFSRNCSNSNTNIKTHVPSLPMFDLLEQRSRTNRHKAYWLAHDAMRDQDDVVHSSYNFSRVLKRENPTTYNNTKHYSAHDGGGGVMEGSQASDMSSFEHELVDISIGLIQGGDMIEIGSTTVPVSGSIQKTTIHTDLIVRNEISGRARASNTNSRRSLSKRVGSNLSKGRKTIKYASFSNDPTRRYSVADNATLSVEICVSVSENDTKNMQQQITNQPYYTSSEDDYNRPFQFINTDRHKKSSANFDDTSTLSESTKSGVIVYNPKTHRRSEEYGKALGEIPEENDESVANMMKCLGMVKDHPSSQESPVDVKHLNRGQHDYPAPAIEHVLSDIPAPKNKDLVHEESESEKDNNKASCSASPFAAAMMDLMCCLPSTSCYSYDMNTFNEPKVDKASNIKDVSQSVIGNSSQQFPTSVYFEKEQTQQNNQTIRTAPYPAPRNLQRIHEQYASEYGKTPKKSPQYTFDPNSGSIYSPQRGNNNVIHSQKISKNSPPYTFDPDSGGIYSQRGNNSVLAQKDPDGTVSSEAVNSIERATQTLHHYASKYGIKAEELL